MRDRAQGLQKGLGAVGLVEQHQAVVAGKTRVQRPHAGAAAIGAKQQARAELVHRGRDHQRLQRAARPGLGAVHAAPQLEDLQRVGCRRREWCRAARQGAQLVGDGPDDGAVRVPESVRESPGALVGLVDDDAPVDDEEDASRRGDRPVGAETIGLGGEREQRDVDAGGLAGRRGQGERLWPGGCVVGQHPLGERALPGEGFVVPDGREEVPKPVAEVLSHGVRPPASALGTDAAAGRGRSRESARHRSVPAP